MKDKELAKSLRDIDDTLTLISGKWRMPILSLFCVGPLRFSEIKEELGNISNKVLTGELRFLEDNLMIKAERNTIDGKSVIYSLTEHGRTFKPIAEGILRWSIKHRKAMMEKWGEDMEEYEPMACE